MSKGRFLAARKHIFSAIIKTLKFQGPEPALILIKNGLQ